MSTAPYGENFKEKAIRKLKEEPLVPVGVGATCLALYMATRSFKAGSRNSMNRWLRLRVVAQGFTVVVLCGYAFSVRERKLREAREQASILNESGQPINHSTLEQQPYSRGLGLGSAAQAAKEKEEFEARLEEAIRIEKSNERARLGEGGLTPADWRAKVVEQAEKRKQEKKLRDEID